jgi:hypothetical protein
MTRPPAAGESGITSHGRREPARQGHPAMRARDETPRCSQRRDSTGKFAVPVPRVATRQGRERARGRGERTDEPWRRGDCGDAMSREEETTRPRRDHSLLESSATPRHLLPAPSFPRSSCQQAEPQTERNKNDRASSFHLPWNECRAFRQVAPSSSPAIAVSVLPAN